MKERMLCYLKNISFVIIIALLGVACGDDKEESVNVGNEGGNGTVIGTVAKVDVKKAGSLSSLIGDDVKFNIMDLTVTGDINGDDIALIREMAGADVNGDETKGHLSKLNLKDANIVAGGNPYYIYSTTQPCYSKKDIVGAYMFRNCNKLETIVLPNNITEIGGGVFSFIGNKLIEYIVTENNTNYSSLDGVLFDKDKTDLIAYPTAKVSSSYIVPSSVIKIKKSVSFNSNLTTINLNNVTGIEAYPFSGGYIREFIVPVANPSYSVENGVLFNKKQTVLIAYPMGLMKDYEPNGQGSNYIIPNGVETICAYAFYPILEMVTVDDAIRLKVYPLETLTIPASVQDIGSLAILGVLNLHCKSETPPRLTYPDAPLTGRNIYVPMSAVNAYKQAVGWREANIIGE
ncbi:leucine-rich repeat protein [Bacteroides finegoldii]|uniref:leucine-rich repeat protein n=1 Tax=Bacteroides finegoldii TaxID=338188 RepID=UPI0034A5167F